MINVFEPSITFKDKLSVWKTLSQNNISGTSPVVKKFESEVAKKFDRQFGVAVTNGSNALDISFKLLHLSKGDEVIIPAFTIISCLSAVIRSGATPVFCDVDVRTWNINFEDLKTKITNKTKAILMVHTYGLTSPANEILQLCKDKNISLIEDAAEAHGQIIDDKKCGSFGEISTLSFYANKHITTGEGGMILTDNKEIYFEAVNMRNLDFNEKRFVHENLYWNYRMSSLQASLGLSQLKRLHLVIEEKTQQGAYYLQLLKKYQNYFQLPLQKSKNIENHFWVFGIVLKFDNLRDLVMEDLKDKGIETRPFFWPLHLQPSLPKKFSTNHIFPISENLGNNGLYLPIGSHINKVQQRYIISSLIKVIEKRIENA
jgi:perosamine synthetase